MAPDGSPDERTPQAEATDAAAVHDADRSPTDEQSERADGASEELREQGTDRRVAEHHQEMDRRGANQRGEGKIV
jgi:hypothetical protein